MEYRSDLRDLDFQLRRWLPFSDLLASGHWPDWDSEGIAMVLDEADRIAREQLAPANEAGDRIGARLEGGRVVLPPGFREAYETLADGGWVGAVNTTAWGGMGLPVTVGTGVTELFLGANMALSLVLMLTRGVGELVEHFGDGQLRDLFCGRLYSGEWTATMCLTESQAGSDVGASATQAEPNGDGTYLVRGEKIFITYGDHDLTPNVVHAVLARLPGAPPGTRGLSLFLVPSRRTGLDGSLGEPNDVAVGGIEHKMGIHGSPTCTILFGRDGGAEAYLLGEPERGMRIMFQLMNTARLDVGLQGTAVASAIHQAALAYAKERIQGRHWQARDPAAPGVPIVQHPDVRRLLFSSAAHVQAMRAIGLRAAYELDRATADAPGAAARAAFLTPVVKAWCTDWGFRVAEWCLQVWGGYGYTRDYPAEQYMRDLKIASLYEGTNGIQALDFVLRKVPAGDGAVWNELVAECRQLASRLADHDRLHGSAEILVGALDALEAARAALAADPALPHLDAVPLLDMFGTTFAGALLLDQARVAHDLLAGSRDEPVSESEATFLRTKIEAAVHFAHRALPRVTADSIALRAGERAPLDAPF